VTQLLAGDIGGTKTILRWLDTKNSPKLTVRYEQEYPSQKYLDLVPMVKTFLEAAQQDSDELPQPKRGCFAIAGPVVNGASELTNLGWQLSESRLSQTLGLQQVALINDFAAVGYGILGLEPQDLRCLQEGEVDLTAPIAVIGAGTGLGQCFVIPEAGGRPRVFATEGGHSDFAPRTALEFRLLEYIQESRALTHVSAERIVSGQGVVAFYQFLRDREAMEEDPAVAQAIRDWEQAERYSTAVPDPGAAIAQAAPNNALCERAMALFAEAYGAETGNLALKLLSYGGVYLAGGIAAKNAARLGNGGFLKAFLDKGRMQPLLERMPVQVILNRQVGLIGAGLYAAEQMDQ